MRKKEQFTSAAKLPQRSHWPHLYNAFNQSCFCLVIHS